MDNKTANNEYYKIDLLHISKVLLQRAWLIVLSGFLAAVIGFGIAAFMITPLYSSSIMLYVNNSSFSLGNTNFSITASEITAAQNLVKTYREILINRTTLERVLDKSGLSEKYSYGALAGMIKAQPSNETEIMKVTVTMDDPYDAALIANTIAEVLPIRVAEIIDGASMEVVDSAIPNTSKVSPSISRHTVIGLVLGVLFSTIVLIIFALMDGTIHDEDYVLQNYDCPILAKVPDLLNSGNKRYGYYYQRRHRNKTTETDNNQA